MGSLLKPDMTGSQGTPPSLQTDLLIVGAGPAGASLACFLASHGLKGVMISAAPSTSQTPRAHITNMAALECLRDIGLEEECIAAATKGDNMQHTRWCHDMVGEEFARIYSWGNDPSRKGDYDSAGPCHHVDLPQTKFEPILVRHAVHKGFTCQFNTTFISFDREPSGTLLSTIKDNLTNHVYTIRSKYLFGADGARSAVIRQLGIPLIKKPGQGLAMNVLVRVDLTQYIESRQGNLHYVFQPDVDYPDWGFCVVVRMVKPWTEWMFIIIPAPGTGVDFNPSPERYLQRVKEIVGDDSIPVEILDVSKWLINETVAEYYSDGNIFCLGDAVHRHPPFNGLGSNSCVQDSFNLAFKIAYVMKGYAGPKLLDSYSLERQPVGVSVITRANQGLRDHVPVWQALGMMGPTREARTNQFAELSQATPEGAARRAALRKAVAGTAHEFHGLGVEMNQRYESHAIYLLDEPEPRPPLPADAILEKETTTYPGSRLPHAWLNTTSPSKQFSTIDLAGHGAFCLLTGIGGQAWKEAAAKVAQQLLELQLQQPVVGTTPAAPMEIIRSYSIGWRQDYEDVYSDWARKREVAEDGCVLVRPDRFVAWRAPTVMMKTVAECEEKLLAVMKYILDR